ncbi:MAG: thioredoxin domain-containing protein, partial [Deltaproteobacteria bacterium]|nr:thioredoxin domain-containing protein [Deltaproteobacteria bacterium]
FMKYFYLIEDANLGGKSLLRGARSLKYKDGLPERVKKLKNELRKARETRTRPATDRKIITAWNGLAISALASASRIFNDGTLAEEAKRSAEFIMTSSRDDNGRLLRYYLEGGALTKANLEDYALFALGLLAIFEATGEGEWLERTGELVSSIKELFYDETQSLFYDTGNDQERLIVRERDLFDNDVPSGNSAAADLFQRYSIVTGDSETRRLAEGIVRSIEGLKEEPLSYGNFLSVYEDMLKEPPGKRH